MPQVSKLELQYDELLNQTLAIRRALECDLGNIEAALHMQADHFNLCSWSHLCKDLEQTDYCQIDSLARTLKEQLKTLEGLGKALQHIGPSKNFQAEMPDIYLNGKEKKKND